MRKKQNEKRTQKYFAIFALILMMSSVIAFVFVMDVPEQSAEEEFSIVQEGVEYNFKQRLTAQNYYIYDVTYNNYSFQTFAAPDYFAGMDIDKKSKNILSNTSSFFLLFNPKQANVEQIDLLRADLSYAIPENKNIVSAITAENEKYKHLQMLNCSNSNNFSEPFVLLENASAFSINSTDKCVTIKYKPEHISFVRDFLVYNIHGFNLNHIEKK